MYDCRVTAAKDSLHLTTGRIFPQKVLDQMSLKLLYSCIVKTTYLFQGVLEHTQKLESISENIQPIRLRYAKLNRKLGSVKKQWNDISKNKDQQGLDSVEIILERSTTSNQRRSRDNCRRYDGTCQE